MLGARPLKRGSSGVCALVVEFILELRRFGTGGDPATRTVGLREELSRRGLVVRRLREEYRGAEHHAARDA